MYSFTHENGDFDCIIFAPENVSDMISGIFGSM